MNGDTVPTGYQRLMSCVPRSRFSVGFLALTEPRNVPPFRHLRYQVWTSSPLTIFSLGLSFFDVITSIVSFLWAYTTAARDVTGERVRTAYDVTAACYHKRRTQRNVFCHTWY